MEAAGTGQGPWAKGAQAVLRLAVSILVLWWVAHGLNLSVTGSSLVQASLPWMGLAFLLLLASAAAAGLVWHAAFPPGVASLSPTEAVRTTLIAFAINNLVPAGIAGEAYRLYDCLRRGLGVTMTAFSLFMDRWCAFLVLVASLALVTTALWLGVPPSSPLDGGTRLEKVLAPGTAILALIFGAATAAIWLPAALPRRLVESLARRGILLDEVAPLAASFWRTPTRLVGALALAGASLLLEALSISVTAMALGDSHSPLVFMALAPILRVVHRFPGFVNGIGAQEVAAVAVWKCMGISGEVAFSVSILLHVIRLCVGLVGLPLYLSSPPLPASPTMDPAT